MLTLYGIKNCDTVKKSTDWLKKHNIPFTFHDYKTQGITEDRLGLWCTQVSWEILLNKKGTTWKGLSPEVQGKVKGSKEAIALMAQHTSLIKRPVITKGDKVVAIGFDASHYEKVFR